MINLSDKLTAKTVENILGESKEIGYIFGDANPRTTNTVAGALNEVKTELLSMVHAGDIVGNPTADWKQGTVEEYVDNKILEQNIKVDEVLKAQQRRLNTLNGNEVIVVNSLPSSGSVGIIYRVPNDPDEGHYSDYMWDINIATPAWKKLASYTYPGLDEVPTSGSANFVKSGGVFDEITNNGAAFDVTVYNSGATYASLSEALNAVPTDYKKGGMSIKYVQSSDNKYVQYRLMADEFNTDIKQWAIADEGVYVENPEFVYVKTDKEGKILWAIKNNGGIYYGAGCPQQIKDYIEDKLKELSLDEYKDIVSFLSDYLGSDTTLKTLLDGKLDAEGLDHEALGTVQVVENTGYINATTDSEGRILEGINNEGKKEINVPLVFNRSIGDTLVLNELDMSSEGIEKLKEDLDIFSEAPSIKITYDAEQKYFEVESAFSQDYNIINSGKFYDDNNPNYNPCLNYSGTYLVNKANNNRTTINYEVDNIAAVGFNGIGYLGGNHGLFPTNKAVIANHGISYDSIGKAFTRQNDSAIFYLVRVIDDNTLQFVPDYTYDDDIEVFELNSKLEAGDVIVNGNTSLTIESLIRRLSADQFFLPSEVIISRKLLLDGKDIIESGTYYGNCFDYLETYDVISPASYIDKLRTLAGTLSANPLPRDYYAELTKMVRFSASYRFEKDGCSILSMDFIPLTKISLDWCSGGLNVKLLEATSLGGSALKYYMPKALPKTVNGVTYDYRTPSAFGFPSTGGLHYYSEDSDTQNTVVDRGVEFITDSNEKPIVGLHHGFICDLGLGGNKRKDYVNELWWIHTTGAVYPKGLEGRKLGNILNIGEHYGYVTYRKYENVEHNPTGVICVSQFEIDGRYYIYGDYEDAGLYQIELPSKWVGKTIKVLEKRSNVEVLNAFSTSIITINIGIDTKQYGYFVLVIE